MTISEATQIIAGTSTVVAMLLSVATFYGNRQIQGLQAKLQSIETDTKKLELQKMEYSSSSRIIIDYAAPLARSFAVQLEKDRSTTPQLSETMFVAEELPKSLIHDWATRNGLMTGDACGQEGLKARQVVGIRLRNIGNTAALDVRVAAKLGLPKNPDKDGLWKVQLADGSSVPYADLSREGMDGWADHQFSIGALQGMDTAAVDRKVTQLVLARVSGATDLYGSVAVPPKVIWTDAVTKKAMFLMLMFKRFGAICWGLKLATWVLIGNFVLLQKRRPRTINTAITSPTAA